MNNNRSTTFRVSDEQRNVEAAAASTEHRPRRRRRQAGTNIPNESTPGVQNTEMNHRDNAAYQEEQTEQLASMTADLERTMRDLVDQHTRNLQAEVNDLRTTHTTEINEIRATHTTETNELRAAHTAEVERLSSIIHNLDLAVQRHDRQHREACRVLAHDSTQDRGRVKRLEREVDDLLPLIPQTRRFDREIGSLLHRVFDR